MCRTHCVSASECKPVPDKTRFCFILSEHKEIASRVWETERLRRGAKRIKTMRKTLENVSFVYISLARIRNHIDGEDKFGSNVQRLMSTDVWEWWDASKRRLLAAENHSQRRHRQCGVCSFRSVRALVMRLNLKIEQRTGKQILIVTTVGGDSKLETDRVVKLVDHWNMVPCGAIIVTSSKHQKLMIYTLIWNANRTSHLGVWVNRIYSDTSRGHTK